MNGTIEPGWSDSRDWIVNDEVSAERYGNAGMRVLATPALIGWLEATAIAALSKGLESGQGSVGTRIDMQHLAATPVGMRVTTRGEIVEVDRKRIVFRLEAHDEREQIASGTHERFVIVTDRFLERAAEKAGGHGAG